LVSCLASLMLASGREARSKSRGSGIGEVRRRCACDGSCYYWYGGLSSLAVKCLMMTIELP
jgi:hypothetical protein